MDTELILSFFKLRKLQHSVVLTCSRKSAQVEISKSLTQSLDNLILIKNMQLITNLDALYNNGNKLAVVIDGDCKQTSIFFRKVAYLNLVTAIKSFKYTIHDVYNPAFERGGKLRTTEVGFYNDEKKFLWIDPRNSYSDRNNLTGIEFKTVIVLPEAFDGTLGSYLKYDREVQINTFNRFHSRLMHYCKDYYNFSLNITLDKSWGYLQSDGTMDGLVGDLQRRKIDFGLSPLFVKKDRLKFISYGRRTYNLRRRPCKILDDLLISHFAGIISFPHSLGGRGAALVTLGLGFLIYQFYSANLMSFLLNVPMTVISTVNELLEARFEIGCEDILYNRDFLKYENSSIIREVLNRLQLKNGSGFLKPEKGLAWVKKGQYAFHVELSTAYSIIKDQFDEKTICELKEIPMFPVKQMHANYQKLSPFKDLIDVW
ncbi:hypothetical protein HUJ05_004321 [Dendroctonus ponderosae]|nr:hypothetical protein HUJ05_004321 [Dendroctonus ponderosae]